MRGAGCTVNDIYDIDLDKQVIRTRNRPLASGQLNQQQALQWLAVQLGISAIILFSLNSQTIVLGICSLFLVGTYPLMKRITNYPQLYLGITFNLGALMGYSAASGGLGLAPLALYSAGICWTMIYDTIYAHQDKQDDVLVGVKSTALKFGDRTMEVLNGFTAAMGLSLFVAGIAAGMGPTYFYCTCFSSCMILRGMSEVDLNCPKSCWEFFIMNRNIGLLVLFAIIIGRFI